MRNWSANTERMNTATKNERVIMGYNIPEYSVCIMLITKVSQVNKYQLACL